MALFMKKQEKKYIEINIEEKTFLKLRLKSLEEDKDYTEIIEELLKK